MGLKDYAYEIENQTEVFHPSWPSPIYRSVLFGLGGAHEVCKIETYKDGELIGRAIAPDVLNLFGFTKEAP